eukprot:gene5432-7523_t
MLGTVYSGCPFIFQSINQMESIHQSNDLNHKQNIDEAYHNFPFMSKKQEIYLPWEETKGSMNIRMIPENEWIILDDQVALQLSICKSIINNNESSNLNGHKTFYISNTVQKNFIHSPSYDLNNIFITDKGHNENIFNVEKCIHVLRSAIMMFPDNWKLEEKIGLSLAAIHYPTGALNTAKETIEKYSIPSKSIIIRAMESFFDKLYDESQLQNSNSIAFLVRTHIIPINIAIDTKSKAEKLLLALTKELHPMDNSAKSIYKYEIIYWLKYKFQI